MSVCPLIDDLATVAGGRARYTDGLIVALIAWTEPSAIRNWQRPVCGPAKPMGEGSAGFGPLSAAYARTSAPPRPSPRAPAQAFCTTKLPLSPAANVLLAPSLTSLGRTDLFIRNIPLG